MWLLHLSLPQRQVEEVFFTLYFFFSFPPVLILGNWQKILSGKEK